MTRPNARLAILMLAIALVLAACNLATASPSVSGPDPTGPSASFAVVATAPTTGEPSAPVATASASSTPPGPYDWSYEGATGPEHWAELSDNYYSCKYGVTQSPIELTGADERRERDPIFDYHEGPVRIVNDGHTVMAVPTRIGRSMLEVHDLTYPLMQLQFHVPPEHVIHGAAPAAAEVQFVHQHATGAFLIVGAMVVEGAEDNAAWAPYIDAMTTPVDVEGVPASIEWQKLIPLGPEMVSWRYDGSLTTPPCTERVDWIFFAKPIELSASQIEKMRAAYDGNARPLQPLGYYRSVTQDLKDD